MKRKEVITIGIKASLVEWERAGGTDRFTSGLRSAEQVQAQHNVLLEVAQGLSGHRVEGDGSRGLGKPIGSVELGLSECSGMGWRLQDLDGASYSASLCAGFSARVERVRKGSHQKSIASATPED